MRADEFPKVDNVPHARCRAFTRSLDAMMIPATGLSGK
jgi:hypothetical protein